MERTSTREFEYAGKRVAAGAKVDVEPGHVLALVAAKAIEAEPGEPGYVEPGVARPPERSAAPKEQQRRRRV